MLKYASAVTSAFFAVMASTAHAEFVDAEQPVIGGSPTYPVFFESFAQTFIAENDGEIIALELPISCGSSATNEAGVSLRDASITEPEGPVLASYRGPISTSDTPAFHRVNFPSPVPVSAGDKLAYIFNLSDGCFFYGSGGGDPYANGEAFFQGQFGEEWFPTGGDRPFKVIMRDPPVVASDDRCRLPNGELIPVWRHAPACRCFEDSSLLETRCGVMHPDFLIERFAPLFVKPGQAYKVRWKFTPRTQLDNPVALATSMNGKTQKTLYFGYKSKPGLSEEVTLESVAPKYISNDPDLTVINYNMKDAADEAFVKFGMETPGLSGQK